MRILFFIISIACCSNAYAVDKIVVYKAERKMELLSKNKVVKEYDISLGRNPKGAKRFQGDSKTPEGDYIISGRNDKSAYHLSLRISYPNKSDIEYAKKHGKNAGGDIMIHGLPNGYILPDSLGRLADWTDGCIAVTDKEIEEIWKLVPNGTKITIKP
jgi:murein L,D-transpeptidase YafK